MVLGHKGRAIRVLFVNSVPWFSLRDIGDALGLNEYGLDRVNAKAFPPFAKMIAGEETDPDIPGDPQDETILSPVGVWYLTTLLSDPKRGEGIAAWAKRETALLCPDPTPGDPSVFLTLLEIDGRKQLPPFPYKYSGRRSEWFDLRDSDEWLLAQSENRGLIGQGRPPLSTRPPIPKVLTAPAIPRQLELFATT